MADGIEAGADLAYELGIQVMSDDGSDRYEDLDLLDSSKIVPEEMVPVQLIGKLTLDRNSTNYFVETEQVAFHTGNLVPGIEPTNDPLMQARLFSYFHTQLIRLGGPNFTQLPINRPHCPVNDMLRDASIGARSTPGKRRIVRTASTTGEPRVAAADEGGYVHTPRPVEARRYARDRPRSAIISPKPRCSTLACPTSSRPTSLRPSHSNSGSATSRRSTTASTRCWPMSMPICAISGHRIGTAGPER